MRSCVFIKNIPFKMNSDKKFFWLLLLVFGLLAGCASSPEKKVIDSHIYWPKPPAPPRFEYVTTLLSDESIRSQSAEDRFLNLLRDKREKHVIFAKPFGVAARNGTVVVTDTVLRQAFIFNLRRQKVFQLGRVGKVGVLAKPLGVDIDASGRIYVADVSARRVYVYDDFGMYLRTIGEFGELDRPVDVAVSADGRLLYVMDAGGIDSTRHRVVAYAIEGEADKEFEFGRRGVGAGEFNLPTQVEVAPDGTVYVLDAGNFRVQAFSWDGKFLRAWGRAGRGFGDFARPRGMAVGGDGNIYVTDTMFRNVQVFNPKGELLLPIGGDRVGDQPGAYNMPADVAIDERQNVYIVDQLFKKVEVLRRLDEQEMQAIVAQRKAKE
jgi:DNA-binding beta-propeller fold protein YncE